MIEREVIKHAGESGEATARKIKNALEHVEKLSGKTVAMPVAMGLNHYEGLAIERLAQLEPVLLRLPTTDDQLHRAYERVLMCRPPNGPKNQQFKDSVIWEAVLDLAADYDVHLVSQDGAFHHTELAGEIAQSKRSIKQYKNLDDLLKTIEPDRPLLDTAATVPAIEDAVVAGVNQAMSSASYGLACGERLGASLEGFPTDTPALLVMRFVLRFAPLRMDEAAVMATEIIVIGECEFNSATERVTEYILQRIMLVQPEEQYPRGIVFGNMRVIGGGIMSAGEPLFRINDS